jgi:nicotinate phosphoribosyltransferase
VIEELVHPVTQEPDVTEPGRVLTVPLVRDGEVLTKPDLDAARALVADGLHSLPWEGLSLTNGEPVIPTRQVPLQ